MLLVTTGCGSSGDRSGAVTINVLADGQSDPAAMQPAIRLFERTHPGIRIKYSTVPFDQADTAVQSRLSQHDKSIDAYFVDQPRVANLAAQGFLLDLSSLVPQAKRDTLPASYAPGTYQGKLYSLPLWTSAQFLFYNKDLLAKAGVAAPDLDPAHRWTWEEVVAAARKAQQAGAKWGLLFDQTDRYYQLQPLAASAGGGSGIGGTDRLHPDIENSGWQKAMSWYGALFKEGIAPRGIDTSQMEPLFNSGKAAFIVAGAWEIQNGNAAKGLHFGVAPHPYFAGGSVAMPSDSWALGVNPFGAHRSQAIDFVKFATLNEQGNATTRQVSGDIPANRKAFATYATGLDRAAKPAPGIGTLLRYELAHSVVHRPTSVGYTQFEDIMTDMFSNVRNGADAGDQLHDASRQLSSAWAHLK